MPTGAHSEPGLAPGRALRRHAARRAHGRMRHTGWTGEHEWCEHRHARSIPAHAVHSQDGRRSEPGRWPHRARNARGARARRRVRGPAAARTRSGRRTAAHTATRPCPWDRSAQPSGSPTGMLRSRSAGSGQRSRPRSYVIVRSQRREGTGRGSCRCITAEPGRRVWRASVESRRLISGPSSGPSCLPPGR
jgi:hypothetical protein